MHRAPADRCPRPRRIAAGLAVVVLAAVASPQAISAPAGAQGARPEQAGALDWLEAELAANDGGLPGFSPGAFDWGLTADAVLALAAGDRGDGPQATATTALVLDHVSDYGTWDDVPGDFDGVRVAGALAKVLLVAQVQGIDDPAETDGFDIEAEVRATMETTGPQLGRFSDVNPHFPTNNANGFGQALAVLGLSYTDDGVPAEAVSFLVRQQCPDGGFRLNYGSTPGCTSAASSDTDTTAMAVQALLTVDPRPPSVHRALVDAVDWLEDRQDATGGWGGTGPTSGLNSNSTGLIAQAMRAAGRLSPAQAGAGWVASVALTPTNAAGSPAAGDIGAIAYTPATRDDAVANGIGAANRDQWRRATAQAVLGLDLPDLGSIGRTPVEPIDPDLVLRTPAESFVTAAYTDFLGRLPTTGELVLDAARAGTTPSTRARVVDDLANSDEWIGTIVVGFYQDTLGRGPDPSGLRFWTDQLRTGRRTVAQAAAEFYASNEYFANRGGGTNEAWVTDLYRRILHREPDAAGRAFWTGRALGRGRVHVAYQMYQSPESRRDRVTSLYVDLLGRGPDPSGRDHWSRRILTAGDIALASNLASSNEYANRAVVRFP